MYIELGISGVEPVQRSALETLFLNEIKTINESMHLGYSVYYWRTSNNMEVDFVLYGIKGILAFEVKRSGRVTGSMLSGLKSFLKDYPLAKAYLIYGDNRYFREGAIEILPMTNGLMATKVALPEEPSLMFGLSFYVKH